MIKNALIICIFLNLIFLGLVSAQQQKNLKVSDLTGIWQRGSSVVGNGLGQNFQFSSDGRFVLNIGDERDDLRTILKISGKCRLSSNLIFFTILTKTILDGGIIGVGDSLDGNIFSIQGGRPKETKISNPVEIKDGCTIKFISDTHIRIINVDYFRIDRNKYKIDPDEIIKW